MSVVKKDRSNWIVKKFSSFEEQRNWQIAEWQSVSGAARRQAAWELVYDYWVNIKKIDPNELRLQRSVTKLTRI